MSTLLQLRSELLTELDDIRQRLSSTSLLTRNINRALAKIQLDTNYSLPENRAVAIITADAQEKNLPADFMRIGSPHGVKVGDSNPLAPADYFSLLGNYNLNNNSGGIAAYYIRVESGQWIIGFYPTPQDGKPVTVPYYKALPAMAADSDNCPLGTEFDEALVQYAAYLTIRRKKDFEERAANYLAFYNEAVNDIVGTRKSYNEHDLRVGYSRRQRYGKDPRQVGDNLT